ncbi:heavy metal-responsive transcriptional regulator [Lyngbya confervoides]|uniref:Heavy metal-responsive transcriptional regulator n=1 Tax=Lyngbya confervoides BDU141951 TaxID=1574623 RepID=A0ABD4T1W8_9CYAN|nr:heavy metal-responsive transcriptional regulator [Lyngbya confervoides]MCM1982376.1 heavy metal-responsive transcriptional regulator [Lyngbya confervoides BDU141951]
MLKVSQVSDQLGINPQTIYFYERIGLIPSPRRNESGYRLFSAVDVERLTFIARAKQLGLSLEDIREVLALREDQSLTCPEIQQRLRAKVAEIDQNIQQLLTLKSELMHWVDRCELSIGNQQLDHDCHVFDA